MYGKLAFKRRKEWSKTDENGDKIKYNPNDVASDRESKYFGCNCLIHSRGAQSQDKGFEGIARDINTKNT